MKSIYTSITAANVEADLKKQDEIQRTIVKSLEDGSDYFISTEFDAASPIKVLKKGGAERVANILGITVEFSDLKTEALFNKAGETIGHIFHVNSFAKYNEQVIAQGVSARSTITDLGDTNTTAKMLFKSAFIDVVMRGAGLSRFFTQDHKDVETVMPGEGIQEMALPEQVAALKEHLGHRVSLVASQLNVAALEDLTLIQANQLLSDHEIEILSQQEKQLVSNDVPSIEELTNTDEKTDLIIESQVINLTAGNRSPQALTL